MFSRSSFSPAVSRLPNVFSTSGRRLPEALLMTWMSFLNSPCTSLMTWTVPFGRVRAPRRTAMAASVESVFGYCVPSARR